MPVCLLFLCAITVIGVVNVSQNASVIWSSSSSKYSLSLSSSIRQEQGSDSTGSNTTSAGINDNHGNGGEEQARRMNHDDKYHLPPTTMMHNDLNDGLVPVNKQPAALHGQSYVARTPVFNVGGPQQVSYKQFLAAEQRSGTAEDWQTWLESSKSMWNSRRRRPSETVVKLIVMMKDEWPLTKHWVLYHGELVGFRNVYILDGSTDPRCLSFLTYARDQLGANVIFTPANLNELTNEINVLVDTLANAADFIIKMDADEYLALHKPGITRCQFESSWMNGAENTSDCSLSPYGLVNYLQNYTNLATLADGRLLRIGTVSLSRRDRALCEDKMENGDFQIGRLPLLPPAQWNRRGTFKALHDARTTRSINLGGHGRRSHMLPPHHNQKVLDTPLGIIHVHFRCARDEILNSHKAVVSHGFIHENDTDKVALMKLQKYTGPEPCNITSTFQMKVKNVVSIHKILAHAQYLAGCESFQDRNMYTTDLSATTRRNPDFNHYLNTTLSKHGFQY
jgi:hypothetical protein